MTKKIMQFRYYGEENDKNQPSNITKNKLSMNGENNIFKDYYPIIQLGIQSIPGTKFYLNNSISPITIGSTGIYELDLNGIAPIMNLSFDAVSLAAIDKNAGANLIVDIIYEAREE